MSNGGSPFRRVSSCFRNVVWLNLAHFFVEPVCSKFNVHPVVSKHSYIS